MDAYRTVVTDGVLKVYPSDVQFGLKAPDPGRRGPPPAPDWATARFAPGGQPFRASPTPEGT